jgi:hypothetical protein
MLGFDLDLWDYLTFLVMFIAFGAALAVAVLVLGLPGRIAIARKHPDADAINTMGWLGFLAVVPWMQAFMWAFKPTNVVDIRYFPRQEHENIEEELARLTVHKAAQNKLDADQAKRQATTKPSSSDSTL